MMSISCVLFGRLVDRNVWGWFNKLFNCLGRRCHECRTEFLEILVGCAQTSAVGDPIDVVLFGVGVLLR